MFRFRACDAWSAIKALMETMQAPQGVCRHSSGSSGSPLVSWNEDGTSLVVWNPEEFAKSVLPEHFRHSNICSFVRRLNKYGFKKVTTERFEFAHEKFIKGKSELLRELHPRRPSKTHTVSDSMNKSEGNANPLPPIQPSMTVALTTQLSNWLDRDTHIRSLISAHMNELNQLLDASAPMIIDRSVTSIRSLLHCAQHPESFTSCEDPNLPDLDSLLETWPLIGKVVSELAKSVPKTKTIHVSDAIRNYLVNLLLQAPVNEPRILSSPHKTRHVFPLARIHRDLERMSFYDPKNSESVSIHSAYVTEIHEIPFSIISRPLNPQELDEMKVQRMMHELQAEETRSSIPPIDVLWIRGRENPLNNYYYSFGGCHRYEAHKRLGMKTIRAKLIKATENDLRIYMGASSPDLK